MAAAASTSLETSPGPMCGEPDDGSLNAPPELIHAARERIAARSGTSADLITVTNASPVSFPLQGVSLYDFKAVDAEVSVQAIALSATGEEMDIAALDDAERKMYDARYGRLSPDLAARLDREPEGQALEVFVQAAIPDWAQEGPTRPAADRPLSDAEVTDLYRMVDERRAEVARSLTRPLVEQLASLGVAAEADGLNPVVRARMLAKDIRQVARWDNVGVVAEAAQYEPTMNVARSVVEADIVNSRGFSGNGIRVAEIEVGGIINTANPFLAGTVQDTLFACPHWHATGVAGVIRSTHATVRGIAPNVLLRVGGSCGGWPNELQNRSTAAANWGARVFNLSLGSTAGTQPGAFDNYYDGLVMDGWRTVVISAGNSGLAQRVSSPGRAYNVVTVGSLDDFNSIPWAGDAMSPFSSGQEPASWHGDREKPEVTADGSNITMTSHASPWVGTVASGTSFSSPIVAGAAALLMQRNGALQVWPEAVKAILMATAIHNVEGATRLSDLDGAGAIVATLADDVAHGVSGNWGARGYSCAEPYNQVLTTMNLISNRTTRLSVVWDQNPAYNQYANQPSADLDVQVISPLGGYVAGSASWDNTYEQIEFTAPMTGTYTVRVIKYRCNLTPKWLGWAWYQRY